jgi:hypothetical protein
MEAYFLTSRMYHGTGNSAQLWQNFEISGWGVFEPSNPLTPLFSPKRTATSYT